MNTRWQVCAWHSRNGHSRCERGLCSVAVCLCIERCTCSAIRVANHLLESTSLVVAARHRSSAAGGSVAAPRCATCPSRASSRPDAAKAHSAASGDSPTAGGGFAGAGCSDDAASDGGGDSDGSCDDCDSACNVAGTNSDGAALALAAGGDGSCTGCAAGEGAASAAQSALLAAAATRSERASAPCTSRPHPPVPSSAPPPKATPAAWHTPSSTLAPRVRVLAIASCGRRRRRRHANRCVYRGRVRAHHAACKTARARTLLRCGRAC